MHFERFIGISTAIPANMFNMFDSQHSSFWIHNDIEFYSPTKSLR
jgi:hypothetical protein